MIWYAIPLAAHGCLPALLNGVSGGEILEPVSTTTSNFIIFFIKFGYKKKDGT